MRFDQAGNVASVETTGKELIASIDPVKDKTPTLGRKRSFFDELFGNIGTHHAARPAGQPAASNLAALRLRSRFA